MSEGRNALRADARSRNGPEDPRPVIAGTHGVHQDADLHAPAPRPAQAHRRTADPIESALKMYEDSPTDRRAEVDGVEHGGIGFAAVPERLHDVARGEGPAGQVAHEGHERPVGPGRRSSAGGGRPGGSCAAEVRALRRMWLIPSRM